MYSLYYIDYCPAVHLMVRVYQCSPRFLCNPCAVCFFAMFSFNFPAELARLVNVSFDSSAASQYRPHMPAEVVDRENAAKALYI